MKIAQIASIIERVPPAKYGGTERIVSELTEALVQRGHDVTLFASGDSITRAALSAIAQEPMRALLPHDILGSEIMVMAHIGAAYQRHREFDLIHDHTGTLGLPCAELVGTPVVTTYHGPFTPQAIRAFSLMHRPHLVTISRSQAASLSSDTSINHAGTVYNGLSMRHYPFRGADRGYLLSVGRISAEKGTHHAIRAAQILGMRLIIAAKLDRIDEPYFESEVKPHLGGTIEWIGEVDETERNRLYSEARCLLHPVTWPEPFGLVMIEALACGAPVVGFRLGSIPEIIIDGVTGFVVDTAEGMARAVEKIGAIDRQACRQYALETFSAERMAEDYEALYRRLLAGAPRGA